MNPEIIGFAGVAMLLIAFVLNLAGKAGESSMLYLSLNVVGCVLAAWYAFAENSIPFVILELVWGGFALTRMIIVIVKRP